MNLQVNNINYELSNTDILNLIALNENKYSNLFNLLPLSEHNTALDAYYLNLLNIKQNIKNFVFSKSLFNTDDDTI